MSERHAMTLPSPPRDSAPEAYSAPVGARGVWRAVAPQDPRKTRAQYILGPKDPR
jgi:hypothetical protein